MTDRISLTVPSHPKYLYLVRSVVYPVALESGFNKKNARSIVLAVDEACANVIRHAYEGDTSRTYSLELENAEQQLIIRIVDTGRQTDRSLIAPRQLTEIRPGGLGTHIIQSVFDSVDYDTKRAAGTLLTLIKDKTAAEEDKDHS